MTTLTEILEAQDTETSDAVEHMVESMRRMAGPPVFRFGGVAYDNEPDRMRAIQMKNFYWVAVRLMVGMCRVGHPDREFHTAEEEVHALWAEGMNREEAERYRQSAG